MTEAKCVSLACTKRLLD